MIDKNKTALTHRITATVAAYLDGVGCKPVETEVTVAQSWIADIATFLYPTMTECCRLKLIETGCDRDRQLDLLRHKYHVPFTIICEVKISKNDFEKDLDKKFNSRVFPAHICYLAFPKGLIEKKDIPHGWAGLETNEDGTKISRIHNIYWSYNYLHAQPPGDIIDLIAQVAIRRDHRTRYEAEKAFWQAYNAKKKKERKDIKIQHFIQDFCCWLRKENIYQNAPLKSIFTYNKIKIPKYLEKEFLFLEALRNE